MKRRYDFSKGKHGRIVAAELKSSEKKSASPSIRIDADLLDYFLEQAEASGGAAGYQTP